MRERESLRERKQKMKTHLSSRETQPPDLFVSRNTYERHIYVHLFILLIYIYRHEISSMKITFVICEHLYHLSHERHDTNISFVTTRHRETQNIIFHHTRQRHPPQRLPTCHTTCPRLSNNTPVIAPFRSPVTAPCCHQHLHHHQ